MLCFSSMHLTICHIFHHHQDHTHPTLPNKLNKLQAPVHTSLGAQWTRRVFYLYIFEGLNKHFQTSSEQTEQTPATSSHTSLGIQWAVQVF